MMARRGQACKAGKWAGIEGHGAARAAGVRAWTRLCAPGNSSGEPSPTDQQRVAFQAL